MSLENNPQLRRELLPYEEITVPEYAETAAKTFTVEVLPGGTIILRGPCPRCDAVVQVPVVDEVFKGMRSGLRSVTGVTRRAKDQKDHVEPMICTCEDPHPNRPAYNVGCGAYWTLRISARP
jgi:hypothetical protein